VFDLEILHWPQHGHVQILNGYHNSPICRYALKKIHIATQTKQIDDEDMHK
jgi:hypothetical protein